MDSCYLYMVHWPISEKTCPDIHASGGNPKDAKIPDVKEVFDTLTKCQKEGKIKHIGVSNFGPKQMKEALATGANIVVNQVYYALFSRAVEYEIIPMCVENKIG